MFSFSILGCLSIKPQILYLCTEHVNESIEALHGGTCLRAVVEIAKSELALQVTLLISLFVC